MIHPIFKGAVAVMAPPTRGEWKSQIEESLSRFSPDAVDAAELLDALIAGMKNRYGEDELTDVLHEYEQMREALIELDRTTTAPGESDYWPELEEIK